MSRASIADTNYTIGVELLRAAIATASAACRAAAPAAPDYDVCTVRDG